MWPVRNKTIIGLKFHGLVFHEVMRTLEIRL